MKKKKIRRKDKLIVAAVCDTPESVERAECYARENGMLFYDPQRMLQMLMGDADVDVKLYFGLNHILREGKGKPSPMEYTEAKPISAEVVADIVDFVRK